MCRLVYLNQDISLLMHYQHDYNLQGWAQSPEKLQEKIPQIQTSNQIYTSIDTPERWLVFYRLFSTSQGFVNKLLKLAYT
jgi:hypothetical protein